MKTILVTGATGRVGGQVAQQLVRAGGVRVRALSRKPAALGPEIEVAGGDLAEPDTLIPALADVDAVFLVFPSVTADAAARDLTAVLSERARRIVYLSAYGVPATPDPHAVPDGTIMGSHRHLEGLIAAAASEYTFLRSSGFAANTLGWAGQIRRSDVLRWFLPEAKRALIHEADLGVAGARVLIEDGHHGEAYHLTGPEQLTQAEQLAVIGDVLGRRLRFEEIDAEQAAIELFPGLPSDVVTSIVTGQAAMVAHPEPMTDTVRRLTGRPARSFARWARDHIDDFTR